MDTVLARIRAADDPGTIVRALAPQDLLWAWRAADDEQRLDILGAAGREQIVLLADMACWKTDAPEIADLEDLLRPLVASGAEGASLALDLLEPELRTLLFKAHARVHVVDSRDDEPPAAEGSELISCADGYYHIEFPDPDLVSETVRGLIAALLLRPFDEYHRELDCVRHDFASELEETARRFREGRLADLGYATRQEGLTLLSPRDPDEVRRMVEAGVAAPRLPADIPMPVLYGRSYAGHAFLDRVLASFETSSDPAVAARAGTLGGELAAMTSRFLTGVGCDLGDPTAVARDVRHARDTLALGLEAVSRGDAAAAVRTLATVVAGLVLQAGLGVLAPMQRRARAVLADRGLRADGVPGDALDGPHAVVVRGLAAQLPVRWPGLDDGRDLAATLVEPLPDELEAFSSLAQVGFADRLLAEAERVSAFVFGALGARAPLPAGATASSAVLTALAGASFGREPRCVPVSAKEASLFAARAVEEAEESFAASAMAVLAPSAGVAPAGPLLVSEEGDPTRRLLLRLVLLGRARLGAGDPSLALLLTP
ncbi:MAG: DUF6178 family protein [Deltaproteobacteria bacterium]|nr:DUF6178 family protein [Deltaproteobacteria bacterium]